MRKVQNYNDFIVDLLFENIGNGVLPLIFSEKFREIISDIKHPIATELLNIENENKPVTLVNITDKNDLVSLANAPKIIDFMEDYLQSPADQLRTYDFYKLKNGEEIWSKNRTTIKLGKLVKKIFGDKFPDNGKPGMDIESFVNSYKVVFDKDDTTALFDLVKGEDIQKWYDEDLYGEDYDDSSMGNSCMNGCYDYLRFYAINSKHVKMLILYEDSTKQKIVGRALVWYLDEPEDRVYMDRIYTIHDYQVEFFKNYAKNNGWLYKSIQTYGEEKIVDSKTGKSAYMDLTVKNIQLTDQYPYLDTLRFLDQDNKRLSSKMISDVLLLGTEGEPIYCERSDRYNKWINMDNVGSNNYVICEIGKDRYSDDIDNVRKKEDAVYLPYYGEWISKDKYDELIVKVTLPKEQDMLKSESIYLKYYNVWADENYVDRTMNYSKYDDDCFYKKDVVLSQVKNSFLLKDNSTKVFTDATKTQVDYVPTKELKQLTYIDKGDYILNK